MTNFERIIHRGVSTCAENGCLVCIFECQTSTDTSPGDPCDAHLPHDSHRFNWQWQFCERTQPIRVCVSFGLFHHRRPMCFANTTSECNAEFASSHTQPIFLLHFSICLRTCSQHEHQCHALSGLPKDAIPCVHTGFDCRLFGLLFNMLGINRQHFARQSRWCNLMQWAKCPVWAMQMVQLTESISLPFQTTEGSATVARVNVA